MMVGSVSPDGSQPVVAVELESTGGETTLEVEAVVDTGSNGELSLPQEIILSLAYPYAGNAVATLADGSTVSVDFFNGLLYWHGTLREVSVTAAEEEPLIGMSLLRGSRLQIEAAPGGEVVIEEMRQG